MRRALTLVFGALALLLVGYRIAQSTSVIGSTTAVTAPNPSAYAPPTPTTSSATAPVSAPSPSSSTPSYPTVHFTITDRTTTPAGTWPFTARLVSITENPNGFTGGDPIPPQDTYLMVQVSIRSGITGRTVPPPEPRVVCHGPNGHSWPGGEGNQLGEGYDLGPEATPDLQGDSIAMGDGQPHLWDQEWQVPEGTNTANVRCVLAGETHYPLNSSRVVGSARLN
jgi:hypothetical protein